MCQCAGIQHDLFQAGDRISQARDGFCDFCRRGVVIVCHALCYGDRILQCRDAFCGITAFRVSVCGRDHLVQLILRNDLPQFLCCFSECSVCLFQLIGSCFFIIKHILRSGDGIFQCLYFAWADIVHIRQDIGIDELDRFFQVCFQRICAFTGIQCLHRFTQVEQCADECGRGSIIWISKQCVGIGDQIVQLIVLQRFCLVDHILQCGHGGLACLFLQSIHRGTQCRCGLIRVGLCRLLIGSGLFCLIQRFHKWRPAVCRVFILIPC